MPGKNDIFDASVMNEIALQRYIRGQTRLMLSLFESFDKKLAALLRRRLRKGMKVGSPAYKSMLVDIQGLRADLFKDTNRGIRSTLAEVSPVEHNKEWAILLAALSLTEAQPKRPTVGSALAEPFSSGASSAATLSEWLAALRGADFRRIREALALALAQEESTDDAVARAVGTRDQGFRNGVVAMSRNNARALVATSIVHVTGFMRADLWKQVPQVAGMLWVSILDLKTTAICRARDNKVVMFGNSPPPDGATLLVPQGARPPAHPNCRSRLVALPRGAARPNRETFGEFLRDQTGANQNKVLGEAKAGMFRRGEVSLDEFVDETGKEFTIKQLEAV